MDELTRLLKENFDYSMTNIHTAFPGVVVKYDKDTQAAISQIKKRNYPQQIAEYTGDILLVGINYDKDTKIHSCIIERWAKE